jgi:tetrahydromethanopterin S-methyltransferase subunit E
VHDCFLKGDFETMRKALRGRFWLETVLAIVTGILFVVTLVWHNWAEIIFNIDPDQGSGLFEWIVVGVLLVVTVVLIVLARFEWRKAQAAIG